MDNRKNDAYFQRKMGEDLAFIVKHTKDIDSDELYRNEVLLDPMMFRLIQISENAKKLSDTYRAEHPVTFRFCWSSFKSKPKTNIDALNQDLGQMPGVFRVVWKNRREGAYRSTDFGGVLETGAVLTYMSTKMAIFVAL